MKLILLFFLLTSLHASTKQKMFKLYQNEEYDRACTLGFNYFTKNRKDEQFLSLYGFSCLKSDYINRLAQPVARLKFSQEARSNAAYFSVILMQKKLLYHSILDGYDLSSFTFPSTDYVLSKVFDLYAKLGKHDKKSFYIFKDPNDTKLMYKLYITKDYKINKMIIEEYYDTIKIKRHIYW
ncbi:hypothetical protein [Sulfurimonas sp.]|uniref:hypothetical protein n=1 Tax=Sulfurimonas sp. TaxID=2022749 RepID=UPI002607E914|nr:hypothetical protein [Sulfurimonas sp.]